MEKATLKISENYVQVIQNEKIVKTFHFLSDDYALQEAKKLMNILNNI